MYVEPFKIHKEIHIVIEKAKYYITHKTDMDTLKKYWPDWREWIQDFNEERITHISLEDMDSSIFISLLLRNRCYICNGKEEDVTFENAIYCRNCGLFQHYSCPGTNALNLNDINQAKWHCFLCE